METSGKYIPFATGSAVGPGAQQIVADSEKVATDIEAAEKQVASDVEQAAGTVAPDAQALTAALKAEGHAIVATIATSGVSAQAMDLLNDMKAWIEKVFQTPPAPPSA
jgi:phosphoserine phosphatase